jgi:hypothetical protein
MTFSVDLAMPIWLVEVVYRARYLRSSWRHILSSIFFAVLFVISVWLCCIIVVKLVKLCSVTLWNPSMGVCSRFPMEKKLYFWACWNQTFILFGNKPRKTIGILSFLCCIISQLIENCLLNYLYPMSISMYRHYQKDIMETIPIENKWYYKHLEYPITNFKELIHVMKVGRADTCSALFLRFWINYSGLL